MMQAQSNYEQSDGGHGATNAVFDVRPVTTKLRRPNSLYGNVPVELKQLRQSSACFVWNRNGKRLEENLANQSLAFGTSYVPHRPSSSSIRLFFVAHLWTMHVRGEWF